MALTAKQSYDDIWYCARNENQDVSRFRASSQPVGDGAYSIRSHDRIGSQMAPRLDTMISWPWTGRVVGLTSRQVRPLREEDQR